jgi:hypothetical protein
VHESTGQTPLDRFAQPDFAPRYPDPVVVAETFRLRVRRKVHPKTVTVEVADVAFVVEPHLRGRWVQVHYDPHDLRDVLIDLAGRQVQRALLQRPNEPPLLEAGSRREGGVALITGEPSKGKSVVLRLLAERLARVRDLTVGALTHPQSNVADFYRELGDLFGVALKPHNRWNGFTSLRERWLAHLDSTPLRPVLPIDEVQESTRSSSASCGC